MLNLINIEETRNKSVIKKLWRYSSLFCLQQVYPGSSVSLPRIIGGSDLEVYQSSDRLERDEWFLEAREVELYLTFNLAPDLLVISKYKCKCKCRD